MNLPPEEIKDLKANPAKYIKAEIKKHIAIKKTLFVVNTDVHLVVRNRIMTL